MFEAFKLVFKTNVKVYEDSNYVTFLVSSKKDVQTVVNYFSFSNLHPLLGNKLLQYNNWIVGLKASQRYCNLNLPN